AAVGRISDGGTRLPAQLHVVFQEPDERVSSQQQVHSMYSLKSSSGASKSGESRKPFRLPGTGADAVTISRADCSSAGTGFKVAVTCTFPCRHPAGRGRCIVP